MGPPWRLIARNVRPGSYGRSAARERVEKLESRSDKTNPKTPGRGAMSGTLVGPTPRVVASFDAGDP